MRIERIGAATLYLADNRDVMPTLPRHDALIGDPPYGQRHKNNTIAKGGGRHHGTEYRNFRPTMWPSAIEGDDVDFVPLAWTDAADIVLLWGAHKFGSRLPFGGQMLVWDKVPTGKLRDQGDGEAAWLNHDGPMRIYRLLWDGMCVGNGARQECTAGQKREHPTQKPVALMEWCLDQARVIPGMSVLDPWMGSGSTGVAAVKRGCPFTGIEIEPLYFDAACRRIELVARQADMFVPSPPRAPVAQPAML